MTPIYSDAFVRFRNVRNDLSNGFFKHVGAIVYSGLFDVNSGGWFMRFLVGLNDPQRAEWANQMGFMLDGAPPQRKTEIWGRWMKAYWQERLRGRPCPLSAKEAEELVDWTLAMTPVFPEAVELLIQSPAINGGRKFGTALYLLEQNDLPSAQPEAVLRLLNWLLSQGDEQWMISNDIEKLITRLPKRKSLLDLLNDMCQRLAKLGYAGAETLKRQIVQDFQDE
jgi:hypothetical protein